MWLCLIIRGYSDSTMYIHVYPIFAQHRHVMTAKSPNTRKYRSLSLLTVQQKLWKSCACVLCPCTKPTISLERGMKNDEIYTLWLFNIAMENGPFIEDLWWFTYPKWWFSIATLNNQTVIAKSVDVISRVLNWSWPIARWFVPRSPSCSYGPALRIWFKLQFRPFTSYKY